MNKAIFLAAILLSVSLTAEARPRPQGAADISAKLKAWETHQQLEAGSRFQGLKWRAIGPVVQGGRVVDIEVVPGQPYTFYAAYASGGLWKTSNNGVTFAPVFDQQPSIIMGDVAVDPNQPETVWVGTGENNASRSSYGGMGVYRSDDGGGSWRYMGLGDTDRIGRILVDPRDSNRVFVASSGKLYTPGGKRGLYRSTDGGESWEEILPGGQWTGFVDLVFKPGDPDTLYAAAWERQRRPWNFVEGGEGSAVWKSTDGGDSWARLEALPQGEHVGRIGLAVSPAAPDTVYVSIDNQELLPESQWDLGDRPISSQRLRTMSKDEFLRQDPQEVEAFIRSSDLHEEVDAESLLAMLRSDELSMEDLREELSDANANLFNTDIRGIEVWRSDDAGASFRLTHEEPLRQVVFSYGYYFGQIRVSPGNVDQVYVLGVPIITSDDGGKSWRTIHDQDVHVDYQAMWINPDQPQNLLVGNDGGMDMSYDGGKSWVKVDAQPVGQFYTVNVDMAQPYNVYGGLQDNGTMRCSSRNDWRRAPVCQRINGGDGMYVAVDPRDNKTTFTGFQFGFYTRINADGSRDSVRPRDRLGEPALRYNWNTPVILSPHNPDVVYFGSNRLYRSMDQGQTWTAISGDLTRSDERGDVPFGTLTTVSESPLAFGLIWAGTDDGQVWVTSDGGSSWTDVARRLPGDRWVSRVEASAHDRDRVYLSLNGYRDDDITAYVYRSENLGKRWTDISKGLPDEPVNVIREDPVNGDVLYVGTDRGVYVSLDRGDSWQSLQGGLPNVPVHDLVVHPRDRELVAGTHGRSFWVVDVLPVQDLATAGLDTGLKVFYMDDIQASRGWRTRTSPWFPQRNELPEAPIRFWSDAAGEARIEVLDGDEQVLQTWNAPAVAGMNTVTWNLLVDPELALAAEAAGAESESLADTPYAESVRLGHRMLIMPGEYQVRVNLGDNSARASLRINKPRDFQPRGKPEMKRRGD
ncbi:MAG: hypothetical protein QNJ40_17670 [Xanthomonadales bacterium]|nr:hypothetical protein [Xanthomonadales bacterium]